MGTVEVNDLTCNVIKSFGTILPESHAYAEAKIHYSSLGKRNNIHFTKEDIIV